MKKYFMIIHILLAAVFFYFSIEAFSNIWNPGTDQGPSVGLVDKRTTEVNFGNHHPLSYYDLIAKRNLFNAGEKTETEVTKLDLDALKQTALKLKLWGTVTGSKEKAYAVIEDMKERRQNLYRLGDSVQNATVKLILREKVVLNLNGKDEILTMEVETSSAPVTGQNSQVNTVKPFDARQSQTIQKRIPSRTFKTRSHGRKKTVRAPKMLNKP